MILKGEEPQILAECLVRCDCMKRLRGRNQVVDQLPETIPITISRADTDLDDVLAIVQRCDQFPGGIESLVRAVHMFEKNSDPMKEVWRCLATILMSNEVLGRGQIAVFFRFSSAIRLTGKKAISAYESSVPPSIRDRFNLSPPEECGLWTAISELSDVPVSEKDEPPYLLLFLHSLREVVENLQHRKKFTDWLSKVQSRLGFECIISKKQTDTESESHAPHILLNLQPKSIQGAPQFHAAVHIWRGKRASDPEAEFEGVEQQVAEGLDRWIAGFFRENDQPVCIEVFVPFHRIFEINPHLWPTCPYPEMGPFWLGCDYPIVVRLDRRERPASTLGTVHPQVRPLYRHEWKQKWIRFQELASDTDGLSQCDPWINENETENPAALVKKCKRNNSAPIMLVPFKPKSIPNRPNLALVMLLTGIPVALWGDVGREEMEGIAEKICLKTLPGSLKELRLEASEKHPGTRVSLLWDDPQRELPAVRYDPENTEFTEDGFYGPQ